VQETTAGGSAEVHRDVVGTRAGDGEIGVGIAVEAIGSGSSPTAKAVGPPNLGCANAPAGTASATGTATVPARPPADAWSKNRRIDNLAW
jgi:hypothetical protein